MEEILIEEMLDTIIGAQLISLDECGFTVRTTNNQYLCFDFDEDGEGDAYNEIKTKLYFDSNDMANAPVITNVTYNDEQDAWEDYACITFFGLNKTLAYAEIRSAGDEYYGSSVVLTCSSTCRYAIITSIF